MRFLLVALWLSFWVAPHCSLAQESTPPHPPDYPGVRTRIPGVFVTPIAGAPFSGTVEIVSKDFLPDGSTYTRRTINHIARSSSGIIYNELRKLVPPNFQGEPLLLSFHIYDPQTQVSTYLDPKTHIARQAVLSARPKVPPNSSPETLLARPEEKMSTQDLGSQRVGGLTLHGTRKQRTVPTTLSGTGREVMITDDYWYSEDLRIYLVLRHNDPRTGEQTVGIVKIDRTEPSHTIFQIPAGYKVVDETPVSQDKGND